MLFIINWKKYEKFSTFSETFIINLQGLPLHMGIVLR